MYFIINQAILPYSIVLVKEDEIIALPLKKERSNILKIIGRIIKENKVKLKDIQGIFVFADSLSFTQSRITITIANLMSKFLNIPTSFLRLEEIKNKKFSEIIKIAKKKLKRKIILPSYDREPNITTTTNYPATAVPPQRDPALAVRPRPGGGKSFTNIQITNN